MVGVAGMTNLPDNMDRATILILLEKPDQGNQCSFVVGTRN